MMSASLSDHEKDGVRRARLRLLRLAAVAVSGAILVLTLSPIPDAPPVPIENADKWSHALAFFVWAGLVAAAWRWPVGLILLLAAAFGGAIELVQPLTGRDAELADLVADMAGAVAGVWLGVFMRRKGGSDGARGHAR